MGLQVTSAELAGVAPDRGVTDWGQLGRDLLYGESDWRASGAAFAEIGDEGFSFERLGRGVGRGALGLLGVAGGPVGDLAVLLKGSAAAKTGLGLLTMAGAVPLNPRAAKAIGKAASRVVDEVRLARGASAAPGDVLPPGILGQGTFDELVGDELKDVSQRLIEGMAGTPFVSLKPKQIADLLMDSPDFRKHFLFESGLTSESRNASKILTADDLSEGSRNINRFLGEGTVAIPTGARQTRLESSRMAPLGDDDYRAYALAVATELKNVSLYLTDTIFNPQFYRRFQKLLSNVEKKTGVNALAINVGLGIASAQASPAEEVARLIRAMKHLKLKSSSGGRAEIVFDVQGGIRAGSFKKSDSFVIDAGRGMAAAMNNPNFVTNDTLKGIGAKVQSYNISRVPGQNPGTIYVADSVDGALRYGNKPSKMKVVTKKTGEVVEENTAMSTGTGSSIDMRINSYVGKILASMYDVPNQAMQEALWAYGRVVREGAKPGRKGVIESSFMLRGKRLDEVLIDSIESGLSRDVRDFAAMRYDDFMTSVRSGKDPFWTVNRSGNPVLRPERLEEASLIYGERSIPFSRGAKRTDKSGAGRSAMVAEDYLGRMILMSDQRHLVASQVANKSAQAVGKQFRGALLLGFSPLAVIPFLPYFDDETQNPQIANWI